MNPFAKAAALSGLGHPPTADAVLMPRGRAITSKNNDSCTVQIPRAALTKRAPLLLSIGSHYNLRRWRANS
jgi:hypothetical protein